MLANIRPVGRQPIAICSCQHAYRHNSADINRQRVGLQEKTNVVNAHQGAGTRVLAAVERSASTSALGLSLWGEAPGAQKR